jgi:multisubunit Na+/H+ antiporter MnhB subunit
MSPELMAQLLFAAFVLFAGSGIIMGITYRKEYKKLKDDPSARPDQLTHAKGIEYASYVAAIVVIAIGLLFSGIVYYILTTLAKILEAVG